MKLPFILSILLAAALSGMPIGAHAQEDREAFIRGRVMHKGKPVAGAAITLADPPLPRSAPIRLPWVARRSETNAEGFFQLSIAKQERYEGTMLAKDDYMITAWSPKLGEGDIGPLRFDLKDPAQDLVIEITRAPCTIQGKVIFPEGRSYRDIWLAPHSGPGYMLVSPDGFFELPDLPSGKVTIEILEGHDPIGGYPPVSATTGRAKNEWFWQTHGPHLAPSWLTVPPKFEVVAPAGKTVQFDLDLSKPARCFVKGKLLLNGETPPFIPIDDYWISQPEPRVSLRHTEFYEDILSHNNPDEAGEFQLAVHHPALLKLHVELLIAKRESIHIWKPMTLKPGTTHWEADVATGTLVIRLDPERSKKGQPSLILKKNEPDGSGMSYQRWNSWTGNQAHYPSAPAGRFDLVRLQNYSAETVLRSVEIIAGQTTTIDLLEW